MGCAQWINVRIETDCELAVCDVKLDEGVAYDPRVGRKPSLTTFQGNVPSLVCPRSVVELAFCGTTEKDQSTKGSFKLRAGLKTVGVFRWDCSNLFGANEVDWTPTSSSHAVDLRGGAFSGAAIGNMSLICREVASVSAFQSMFNAGSLGFAGL